MLLTLALASTAMAGPHTLRITVIDGVGDMVPDASVAMLHTDGTKEMLPAGVRDAGMRYLQVDGDKIVLHVSHPDLGEGVVEVPLTEAPSIKLQISFDLSGAPIIQMRELLLGGCPGEGDCCVPNGSPGCDDAECCEAICGADPFCCDTEWDGICAAAANDSCAVCDGPPPGGDCECEADDLDEGEPCGDDNNGGCNSTPPAFTEAACGQSWCGNAWAEAGTRDTDWYRVFTDQATTLTGTATTEFTAVVFIVDGIAACAPVVVGVTGDGGVDCRPGNPASADVGAGQFVVFVATADFDGTPCGTNNDYRLEINATPCGGNDACGPGAGDCFIPNGTPGCDDVACCNLICDQDPFCCDSEWDGICANAAIEQCNQPGTGACCNADGSCSDGVTADACAAGGGFYAGDGTTCASGVCDGNPACGPGAGPCDIPNGTPGCDDIVCCNLICGQDPFCCDIEWDGICAAAANAQCDAEPGACCFPDGSCEDGLLILECEGMGGTFQGEGTLCADIDCQAVCGPGAGDCFIPNGTPGCDDAECCALICAQDPFCCDVEWDGICASAAIAQCGEPCDLPCDGTDEGEACGDDTNGGCNSTPPVFGSISCDETICGTAWAEGGTRDTDWFLITLAGDCNELTAQLNSQFNGVVFVVDGIDACAPIVVGQTGSAALCVPGPPAIGQVGSGNFVIFVATAAFEGVPCGGGFNDYSVSLSCATCEAEACCFSSGDCQDLPSQACSASGGVPQGPGTNCANTECVGVCEDPNSGNCCIDGGNGTPGCDDFECCTLICAQDPFCCDVSWDGICAAAAQMQCGVCQGLGGACCFADGTCQDLSQADCAAAGGNFQGIGTECASAVCPVVGENDLCENAIAIGVPSTTIGTTAGAGIDAEFPFCGTSITAAGIWYTVTGTGNTMTATTCGDFFDYDTKISVYCSSCDAPICVGGNDDNCVGGASGLLSTVTWCSQAGAPYFILMHGFGGGEGSFVLDVFDDGTPCGGAIECIPPEPTGACCIGGLCIDLTQAECAAEGGQFFPDESCAGGFLGYDVLECRNAFEDISGSGIEAPNASNVDDAGDVVDIGFTFSFFGISHAQIGVCSNGYLTFGPDLSDFTNDPIPNTTDPNDLIAPWWDDWSPNQGGTVHYQTLGSAPNRRFVAQWTDVVHFGGSGNATFQAVLFEGSNCIDFRYGDPLNLDSPTVGVENPAGTDGVDVGSNFGPGDCVTLCPATAGGFRCPIGDDKGACCFPDGSCAVVFPDECGAGGGMFIGSNTVCSVGLCAPPEGGCCFDDGSCISATQNGCNSQGGDWQGAFTNCVKGLCVPIKGACCFGDGSCAALTQVSCAQNGGAYQGDGTVCTPGGCVPGQGCTACGLDGDLEEGEPCGDDNNGGCNSSPPAFFDAACGDTICGNAWADMGTRDTDWYLVSVDANTEIRGALTSQFDGVCFIVDGIPACGPVVIGTTGASNDCVNLGDAFACVAAAGDYVVFAATSGFDGTPCGSGDNDYHLAISCSSPCDVPQICGPGAGDCCDPNGNGTPGCDDVDCCETVCAADPFCCDVSWDGICAAGAADLCGNLCGDPGTGACCFSDGSCADGLTEGDCSGQGGVYQGDGTDCNGVDCTPSDCPGEGGDCCSNNGTPGCDDVECCTVICAADPFCCDVSWDGICAAAAQDQCEVCQTPQACCFPDGSCEMLAAGACSAAGGTPQGAGVTCMPNPCGKGVCGPGNGDCFIDNGTPGCDDADCCAAVCAIDPFCCDVSWDGICAGEAADLCGDPGACCFNDGSCAEMTPGRCVAAGGVFVGGPCDDAGCSACELSDCDGNVLEGEACGDDTNGGCNSTPPAFTDISCGDSICGNAWAEGGTRDTDWYLITLGAGQTVTASFNSEFNGVCFIVDGIGACAPVVIGVTGAANQCVPGPAAEATIMATGDYVVFGATAAFDGTPCGTNNDYTIDVACSFAGK